MRRFSIAVIAAASAVAFTQVAAAADTPAYDWTGVYVGANAGGTWSSADWTFFNGSSSEPISQSGSSWIAGGQVGGLVQIAPHWVAGVEASWSGTDVRDDSTSVVIANRSRQSKMTDLVLATGRLGYARDKWLGYVKGGYANANIDFNSYIASTRLRSTTSSGRDGGWTVGGGIEYGLSRCVSVGVEYDFSRINIGFRNQRVTMGFLTPETVSDADGENSTVWARLNVKLEPLFDELFGG